MEEHSPCLSTDMKIAFDREPFSYPFKILKFVGHWPLDSDDLNPVKRKCHIFYRIVSSIYEWQIIFIGIAHLYLSLNNFKKIVYNLCVTILTTTIAIKYLYFISKTNRINKLRLKLFLLTLDHDDEDVKILDGYRHSLRICKLIFYYAFLLLASLWLLSSLLSLKWGPRELPFPLWLPLDIEDNLQFGLGFLYHAFAACIVIGKAIHAELAMFSLILQVTGHIRILGKDLMKINDFYAKVDFETDCKEDREKHLKKFLTRVRVKKELKSILKRQMKIKAYVREVEHFLYVPMLLQLFGGLVLSVLNGFELIEATIDFNYKLSYQMAYTVVVLTDLFICCLISDFLIEESNRINNLLYSLPWYEMENDIRKDILLMIVGAQRIDRLTVGKFFPLNLSTYLGVIKNLYSWLAMFRTVVQKK